MRVEHLDCGPMSPPTMKPMVAHVFLVDPGDGSGLVLVDTGYGTPDVAAPARRIGPTRFLLNPRLNNENTALHQLRQRGISPDEVAHIVLTHLDFDHAGGLSDFPDATVHTTADEHRAAISAPVGREKSRYRKIQFEHGPNFVLHEGRGDVWREGLTGHEVVPGVTLIPMPGHSRGHAAVAVETAERGTLVHAGDASFDGSSFADVSASGEPLEPVGKWRWAENMISWDKKMLAGNHATLRRLNEQSDVTVVNAHDPRMLAGVVAH